MREWPIFFALKARFLLGPFLNLSAGMSKRPVADVSTHRGVVMNEVLDVGEPEDTEGVANARRPRRARVAIISLSTNRDVPNSG